MENSSQYKELGQQLSELQRPLFAYIVSLVGTMTDADDLLQETNRVVWERADEFTSGSFESARVFGIARFQVMKWRKEQSREKLRFGDEMTNQLADAAVDAMAEANYQHDDLYYCLGTLKESDREMISSRYLGGSSVHEIAGQFDRSEKSIYRSIARIRNLLFDCVQRRAGQEGRR